MGDKTQIEAAEINFKVEDFQTKANLCIVTISMVSGIRIRLREKLITKSTMNFESICHSLARNVLKNQGKIKEHEKIKRVTKYLYTGSNSLQRSSLAF
jgi:hypothetical protein